MQIRVKHFVLNERRKTFTFTFRSLPVTQPSHELYATYDYSKIRDPNKRDAKDKTDDRKGTVFSYLAATEPHWPPIVEFRIPGYPGPSNEFGTEVRLMRGKIFRGKIQM